MSSSNDSNQSAEAAAAAPGSSTTFAAASRRLNRRFSTFLDQSARRHLLRRRRLVAVLGLLTVCLGVGAAFTALRGLNVLWPALLTGCLLLALWAGLSLRMLLRVRQEARRMRGIVQGGVPVNVFLIQANSALFKPQQEALPCLVLISFQPEVSSDMAYMQSLARRVFSLKSTRQMDADGRYIAGLAMDERFVPHRRRPLPFSFTDGSTIYCADLWVRPSYLKGSSLQSDVLPCIAEPGASGGIELVPWWLIADAEKPLTTASSETETRLA